MQWQDLCATKPFGWTKIMVAFLACLWLGSIAGGVAHSACGRGCQAPIRGWGWYSPFNRNFRHTDADVAVDNIYGDGAAWGHADGVSDARQASCTGGSFVCYPDQYELGEAYPDEYTCDTYGVILNALYCSSAT